MPQIMSSPVRRQVNYSNNDSDYCPYWWWSCDQTGFIVRWVVIGVIVALFLIFVIGGYWHAKRRMSRGLPPLRYHRWLVSRSDRARFPPPPHSYWYRPYGAAGREQMYPMNDYGHNYPPAPPAYHEAESVPVYTPPSKVNPDQAYTAPQGPPPQQAGFNPDAGSSSANYTAPIQPVQSAGRWSRK